MLERMSFFAKLCKVDENPELGMWLLYGVIIILSALVYNLGFARKLSIIKNIVIYISLAIGCTVLTFFAVFFTCWRGACCSSNCTWDL
ncbi:YlaH-like family protein [Bacillus paranthracis]